MFGKFSTEEILTDCTHFFLKHFRTTQGTHEWHKNVVDIIREYNAENPMGTLGILLDTKGPEVRSGDLQVSPGEFQK